MLTGCNYGSYLYDANGSAISVREIRHDEPDNLGARVTLIGRFIGVPFGAVA